MHLTRTIAIGLISAALAAAQSSSYSIHAFAGLPRSLGDGGAATSALLWSPRGVSVDSAGNLYIADTGNARIRKVALDGTITTVAGIVAGFSGDGGPAINAMLSFPTKIAIAPSGDLYISDSSNNRIRRISAKHQYRAVSGFGQGACQQQFSTGVRLACKLQVQSPERGPFFHIVVDYVIEKDGVHGRSSI